MSEEQQELLVDQAPPTESEADSLGASGTQPGVIVAELLLDSRRVTGEVRLARAARRLVDILNALDDGYLTVHSGALRDGSGSCLEFDLMQLDRSSILVAFPHQGSASRIQPGEVIEKQRRLVTVIMPGCQVSGYFHAARGVDPSVAPASVGNRFVALTDATITIVDSDVSTRFEPVALLNTAHAQAYVWTDEAKSPSSPSKDAEALPAGEPTDPTDSSLT
jgi:hypothetical protein